MLEGYFLFAVLFRVSHMGVLDSGTHCGCPNWTAARKQHIFIYWLFDHAGLKVRAAQNNNTPYWQDSTTFEVFKNIACCFGGDVNTEQLFDVISPARLQSTFLQGHRFIQLTGLKPRNTPRVFQPLDPTFSPSTPPKVGGRKSRMQPMLLPYVLLPWLLRGEARSSRKQRVGNEMWGGVPQGSRWDVEGSTEKILGPHIFLEILGPNWTVAASQHALRFCRILVRQNAQAIQGPDVNVMWSLAADVGVKFPSAAATPNLGESPKTGKWTHSNYSSWQI